MVMQNFFSALYIGLKGIQFVYALFCFEGIPSIYKYYMYLHRHSITIFKNSFSRTMVKTSLTLSFINIHAKLNPVRIIIEVNFHVCT